MGKPYFLFIIVDNNININNNERNKNNIIK